MINRLRPVGPLVAVVIALIALFAFTTGTASAAPERRNLEFAAGANHATVSGEIDAGSPDTYLVEVAKNQRMEVAWSGSGVGMSIYKQGIKQAQYVSSPFDMAVTPGIYEVTVYASAAARYQLTVTIV
ncbi:hypothetical protein [Nocardia huaxiensis]|uniref:Uncharacterized protein n=1 Tax=Nocardia huaxiensis TaxID=2755382 RepID=A0A7D6ZVS5_9NOCA|nr:hypothetical protein [Nocardia huaxiensis]QLY29889.1 hypothetical protein H0264_32530 [Nocardia huaxiensis]UFS96522.1 hypothetical protein LPY97_00840 [Nocardia huaxiensis]